jgi:hypothetical protein
LAYKETKMVFEIIVDIIFHDICLKIN